jgi:hypothetical protein
MKKTSLIILLILAVNYCFGQKLATSSKIEILWVNSWWPGKILEIKGDKFKVHYSNYPSSYDEWVTKERIRIDKFNDGKTHPNAPVAINTDNKAQATAFKPGKIAGIGKLYSGSSPQGGTVYYLLYPSGQIIMGCPRGGLENFNFNAFCSAGSGICGTYTTSGKTITVHWSSGNILTGKLIANGDMELNSSLVGPVIKCPARLSASYEFTASLSGLSVVEVTKFNDDGTYQLTREGGYDNNDGKNSAEWQSASKGTYNIKGYTITMTDQSGKISRHTIYALDEGKMPGFLGWDGNFLSRAK